MPTKYFLMTESQYCLKLRERSRYRLQFETILNLNKVLLQIKITNQRHLEKQMMHQKLDNLFQIYVLDNTFPLIVLAGGPTNINIQYNQVCPKF